MSEQKSLVETRTDGAVAVIRMVNDRSRNSLSNEMRVQLSTAFSAGLVAQAVADAELDKVYLGKAHELANGPAGVIGLAKLIVARSFETGLDEIFLYEGLGQALAMSSAEFREGLDSLLEKRPARFKDKTTL